MRGIFGVCCAEAARGIKTTAETMKTRARAIRTEASGARRNAGGNLRETWTGGKPRWEASHAPFMGLSCEVGTMDG